MQITDFLSVVLPAPGNGFYCAVELERKKVTVTPKEGASYEKEELRPRKHTFVDGYGDIVSTTQDISARRHEAYFALASFKTRDDRKAANSSHIRSFFLDVDAGGRSYADTKSAIQAIGEWVANTGFPTPYMVASGYGVHAYFPFAQCVPISVWKPVAEALKRACAAKGLVIDDTVTADASRVLRCPGTNNHKHDGLKSVRIICEGDSPAPFDHFVSLLADWKDEKPALAKVRAFDPLLDNAPDYAKGKSPLKQALFENTQHSFERILELGDNGCLQIQHYLKNAADEGMEPLFRSVISIAKFCENGEQHAHDLGALHPYSAGRIARKFSDIGGPQKCDTFDRGFPGVCATCKQWGKITTPIVLGRELRPQRDIELIPAQRPVIAEQAPSEPDGDDVQDAEGQGIDSGSNAGLSGPPIAPPLHKLPTAPDGFSLAATGVYGVKYDPEGPAVLTHAADTPFYATATYDRLGERFVEFTFIEHGIVKNAILPLQSITGKDDAIRAFAKIGIIVPANGDVYFRLYIKATIAEAKKNPVISMPTNLGWQQDDSFVFDNRVFSVHGESKVPMQGFDNISRTIGPRGTLDGWRLVIAAVMRMGRWDVISMMSIGFAAPLMRFTGLNGVTFHLCGNDSGMGKTASQRLCSSVWGRPDEFRTTPNTSPLAMMNRLGMLGSLPLCVDEITHMGRKEVEWFPEFLSQMSDGRGKDRMESQTNAERINTTQWATLALMTSNKTMMDYLTGERAHGSEGEIRRLVEIPFVNELKLNEQVKSLLLETLPDNCGVAGEAYARWLANNVDTAKKVVKHTYNELFEGYAAKGDERFWIAGCACIVAGVRLASRAYANVIEIPQGKIIAYLLSVVKEMRAQALRSKRTAVDVLNEFTKRNFGKVVVVNERALRIAGIDVAEVHDKRDLCARVEKHGGYIHYYIEEREMKAFCSSLSFGYSEFKAELHKKNPIAHVQKNLLAGAKGPAMPVKCIYVHLSEADANKELFFDEVGNEIATTSENASVD